VASEFRHVGSRRACSIRFYHPRRLVALRNMVNPLRSARLVHSPDQHALSFNFVTGEVAALVSNFKQYAYQKLRTSFQRRISLPVARR
jgi:hypothetical protein